MGDGAKRTRTDILAEITGGDDRIRTCEGLLTLNGLANRRLQPLGHISVPQRAKTNSSRETRIVKDRVVESQRAEGSFYTSRFSPRPRGGAARCRFSDCGLRESHRAVQLLDI